MGKQVLLLRSGKQEMSVSKETECLHIDVCDGTSAQLYLDIKADVAKLCIEMAAKLLSLLKMMHCKKCSYSFWQMCEKVPRCILAIVI